MPTSIDLFYTDPFVFPCIVEQNIRFSSVEEVVAMKFEVIAQGGRKKDFWDIHELLEKYTLNDMIDFYIKRNPYGDTKKELLNQIKLLIFLSQKMILRQNALKAKFGN